MEVFMRRAAFVAAILTSMFVDSVLQAATLPHFRLQIYGLSDAEHTGLDGRRHSGPRLWGIDYDALSASGRLVGDSASGDGVDSYVQSAWISNG